MKKSIVRRLSLLLLFAAITLSAFPEVPALRVSASSGESVIFSFDSQPTVSFDSDYLSITTETETVEYPMTSDIIFDFVDIAGVEDNHVDASSISIHSKQIFLKGLVAGSKVYVFDITGKLIELAACDNEGKCDIDASAFVGCPLIIKTTEKTFKILIR